MCDYSYSRSGMSSLCANLTHLFALGMLIHSSITANATNWIRVALITAVGAIELWIAATSPRAASD